MGIRRQIIKVKRVPDKDKTKAGTIIYVAGGEGPYTFPGEGPETFSGQEAEVVFVEEDRTGRAKLGQVSLKVGDRILFGGRAGSDIKVEGEHLILRDEDIIGVLKY